AFTDAGLPVGVDLGQVVDEVEGGARTVGAVHDGDLGIGKVQAAVECDDGRVVPLGDPAQEDVGQGRAVELHRARLHAGDIEHRHHAADYRRKLHQARGGQFFGLERRIGGTEVHRVGLDLGNAAARADRLVVHLLAGGGVVVGRPLGHDRIDEG